MKSFYEVQLTTCKTTKKFNSNTFSWYYESKDKAYKKYTELKEYCNNYDDFCKGWKYLHVMLLERKFND